MQQSSTDTGSKRPRIRRRKQSPRPHPEIPAIQRLATSSILAPSSFSRCWNPLDLS
ncbi:hypothetical protein PI125_g14862 [Phytophthora idaei]|nr:hypothetical protein PI125_g14862 [Phytophthora idaei]